jgi:hypothetical protein
MTDKELLELAAKAADVKYDAEASKPHPKSGAFWGLWLVIDGEPSEYQRRYWNPLTDDGDALRLAVNLKLIIDPVAETLDGTGPCAAVWCKPQRRYIMEPFGDDPYAATRRAITRTAAEIGKAMP